MKTKIIISFFLLISAHNNFCMLINPSQTKHVQKICTAQQTNQKAADTYLKPFMLRSLLKNSEMFDKQNPAVQRTIIRQCKKNHDTSPIIGLIQLPIEDQIKIISYFFEDECKKTAEYFISIPLEIALKQYNYLQFFQLLCSKNNISLPESMIFRLTEKEKNCLFNPIENYNNSQIKKIINNLPSDILNKLIHQNAITTIHHQEITYLINVLKAYYYTYSFSDRMTQTLSPFGYGLGFFTFFYTGFNIITITGLGLILTGNSLFIRELLSKTLPHLQRKVTIASLTKNEI